LEKIAEFIRKQYSSQEERENVPEKGKYSEGPSPIRIADAEKLGHQSPGKKRSGGDT